MQVIRVIYIDKGLSRGNSNSEIENLKYEIKIKAPLLSQFGGFNLNLITKGK